MITAKKAAEKTVTQNKIRIQAGMMAPSENTQAEATVAQQKVQVSTDENALIQAKYNLLRDIGFAPTLAFDIDASISAIHLSYPDKTQAENMLLANNISYQSSLFTLKNNELSLLQAQDQQRSTLNLVGLVTQGSGSGGGNNQGLKSLFNGENDNRGLALNFSMPIDNMPLQQVLVQAKIALTQQQLAVKQLKLQLEAQLEGTVANLAILRQQIILAKNAADLAWKAYQDALIKLSYGQVSMFEVSTLQTNYISAALVVINNKVQYLNAIAQFQENLGISLDTWDIHLRY